MAIPATPYRLDAWDAPAPAGGVRTSFLKEAGGRAIFDVQVTRSLQAGESTMTFGVAVEHHALADLAPQHRVLRLTRFVPTGPDTYDTRVSEWRVVQRVRGIRRGLATFQVTAVPLEEDLLDLDLHRETTSGGFALWEFSVTDQTPTEVLTRVADRLAALGHTWVVVGTVTPTTPVSFLLRGNATPRAIISALIEALAAKGVTAEFQFTLASDLSEYRLELPTAIASSYAALPIATDGAGLEVEYEEDATEQANTVIPFGLDGVDLREFQAVLVTVNAGTGWCELAALDGTQPQLLVANDQFTGAYLFRESTGRTFAILDGNATTQEIQLTAADIAAAGLAAGERVSFRATEDLAGTRRFVTDRTGEVPVQVASSLTGPPRIRTTTHTYLGAGNWLGVADHLLDWTAERSQFIEELDGGTINETAGTIVLDSAPVNTPAVDDWILFHGFSTGHFFYGTPVTVTGWNAGTRTLSFERRYGQTQVGFTGVIVPGILLYRPVGTPMRIVGSTVLNNEIEVDALTGPAFAATDVLEIWQRCQGTRLVELTDPVATAAGRRKVATVEVADCTGATNRVPNADLAAWAGAASDPPDGSTLEDVVGTVTITRTTDPLYTRYGGKSAALDFASGASAEFFSSPIAIHPVPGATQVSLAVALLFQRFTGDVAIRITLYQVDAAGDRTAVGDPIDLYAPDTTLGVDPSFKAAIDAWYDAVITNVDISAIRDEVLQIGVQRPAGGSNTPCTVYVDAFMLLQREGLPEATEGGVRWVFGSDALAMVVAGNTLLLERASPLVRYETTVLDLFRLEADRYAPHELIIGRTVALTIGPIDLTASVRIVTLQESLDDPRLTRVALHRVRPSAARLLGSGLALRPVMANGVAAPRQVEAAPVTYAKLQNVTAGSRLLGRGATGDGDVTEIVLGTNLSMSGNTLNAAGGGSGSGITTDEALALEAML